MRGVHPIPDRRNAESNGLNLVEISLRLADSRSSCRACRRAMCSNGAAIQDCAPYRCAGGGCFAPSRRIPPKQIDFVAAMVVRKSGSGVELTTYIGNCLDERFRSISDTKRSPGDPCGPRRCILHHGRTGLLRAA